MIEASNRRVKEEGPYTERPGNIAHAGVTGIDSGDLYFLLLAKLTRTISPCCTRTARLQLSYRNLYSQDPLYSVPVGATNTLDFEKLLVASRVDDQEGKETPQGRVRSKVVFLYRCPRSPPSLGQWVVAQVFFFLLTGYSRSRKKRSRWWETETTFSPSSLEMEIISPFSFQNEVKIQDSSRPLLFGPVYCVCDRPYWNRSHQWTLVDDASIKSTLTCQALKFIHSDIYTSPPLFIQLGCVTNVVFH